MYGANNSVRASNKNMGFVYIGVYPNKIPTYTGFAYTEVIDNDNDNKYSESA